MSNERDDDRLDREDPQSEPSAEHESEEPTSPRSDDPTRRGILTTIGAVAFGFTAIGGFGGSAAWSKDQVGPVCTELDTACTANCKDSAQEPVPDVRDIDEVPACQGPDGDCDAAAPVTSGRDQSCTDGSESGERETDEACQLVPSPNKAESAKDTDESCGGEAKDPDEACGDCNDNHDTDQNCGNEVNGATDSDQLCGHASYLNPDPSDGEKNSDQACRDAEDVDEGCGTQGATYAKPYVDTDNACDLVKQGATEKNPDRSCIGEETDQFCGQNVPKFGSSPDESCTTSGSDEGCGQTFDPSYDADEGCSQTNADESCGKGPGSAPIGSGNTFNEDEHCSQQNTDQGCGTVTLPPFGIEVQDTDQHA